MYDCVYKVYCQQGLFLKMEVNCLPVAEQMVLSDIYINNMICVTFGLLVGDKKGWFENTR